MSGLATAEAAPAVDAPAADSVSLSSDEQLKRRIVTFLFDRHRPSLRRVRVNVVRGTVELQGRVGSFYEKQLCLNCCQRVAGVMEVRDRIEVA